MLPCRAGFQLVNLILDKSYGMCGLIAGQTNIRSDLSIAVCFGQVNDPIEI